MAEYPENWRVMRLGDAVEINPQSNRGIPDEFVYVDLESVKSGKLVVSKPCARVKAPSRAQRRFQLGDVLYQTVRPYQRNNLFVDFEADQYIASTGYAVLHDKEDVSFGAFIYQYIHQDGFIKDVLDRCIGTSYPAINPAKLAEISIHIPPISEQKRIAAVLSTADKLIANVEKRIAKQRAIKQGVMHDLLTGKKRLPGFSGEWKCRSIGSVLSIGHGKDYKDLKSGDVPVYGTGGLMCHVDGCIHEGPTVCVGRKGTIDKPMYFEGKIWTVDTLFYTYDFIEAFPKFVYYKFLTIDWLSYNAASGVPSLNAQTIEEIKLNMPCDVSEQRAIAKVLGNMDAEIANLERKLVKLKLLKQGMMQDLLTGKVRLKG